MTDMTMNEIAAEQNRNVEVNEQNQETEIIDSGIEVPCKRTQVKGKDGTVYNNFSVSITVLGKTMEIRVAPKKGDPVAYKLLDLIYSVYPDGVAPLAMIRNVSRDDTGKKMEYMTYEVYAMDGDIRVACKVVPETPSNKELLVALYKQKLARKTNPF